MSHHHVEMGFIRKFVNITREQIRKGIEDSIKYIQLHIKLQEECRKLCCGLETLDINDVATVLRECNKAIKILTIEINTMFFDHPNNKKMIAEKQNQKDSLQNFINRRIIDSNFQKLQQKYGALGHITDELDEQHMFDLIQKTLKTQTESLLKEEVFEKKDEKQVNYLYIWMSLIIFILIDDLKKTVTLQDLSDEQILNAVSYVLNERSGFTPMQNAFLENKIYETERQFSTNNYIKPPMVHEPIKKSVGVGGNREKKYHRRHSRLSKSKPRCRRPHRNRTSRK